MKGVDECANDVEKMVKSVWKYVESLRNKEKQEKNKKIVLTKEKRCSILIFALGKRGKDNGKRIERDE